jgi:hypothetical protein
VRVRVLADVRVRVLADVRVRVLADVRVRVLADVRVLVLAIGHICRRADSAGDQRLFRLWLAWLRVNYAV